MIVVKPSVEILTPNNKEEAREMLMRLEQAGRTCYKSENLITEESYKKYLQMILDRKHEAVIEHASMTIKFICDRGVTHEIVRHRIASYAQESTRYCNYSKDKFDGGQLTFILPNWHMNGLKGGEYNFVKGLNTGDNHQAIINSEGRKIYSTDKEWDEPAILWLRHMLWSELTYLKQIDQGWQAQQARSVLPNSLKTEIVMTAILREWRHFFKLRCAEAAHPQMREVAIQAQEMVKGLIPIIFDKV
jgi:thymidylate synthase (FAD)